MRAKTHSIFFITLSILIFELKILISYVCVLVSLFIFDYNLVGVIDRNFPKGLSIRINGNNNYIKIEFPIKFSGGSHIGENGDNNNFEIGSTLETVNDAEFYPEEGSSIIIGRDCQFYAGRLRIIANNNYKNNSKVIIGNSVYIAVDNIIRTSNGHTLIDAKTGKALPSNEPQDVIIEDNVWICSRCVTLKGSYISEGSIVGACSLVNKKFNEPNVLIAGNPAKIIKHDITWDKRHYNIFMKEEELNEIKQN